MILRDPRGFTLPEVLLTIAVIGIGLAAIMSVIPIGAYGVQEGKQLSTATFLADQKLEQIRNLPWVAAPAGFATNAPPANDCLGTSTPATSPPAVPVNVTVPAPGPGPACFDQTTGAVRVAVGGALPWLANENATAIAGFSGYSRQVRVTDCGVGAGCTPLVGGGNPIQDPGMRLVTVTVTYTPLTGQGVSPTPKSVTVNMVVAQR